MLNSSQQKAEQAFFQILQTQPEASLFAVRKYNHKEYADDRKNPTQETELSRDNKACSTILIAGQTLQGTGFEAKIPGDLAPFMDNPLSPEAFPPIRLTTKDVTRYKMAWRALEFYGQPDWTPQPVYSGNWWYTNTPSALVQRSKDWPDIENIHEESSVGFGFTTAGVIYGGLHALAWFAHFESSTQQLLWRISACVVMGGFPVCWGIYESADFIDDHWSNRRPSDDFFRWFFLTALALVMLAYILARAYLVVECFINLSHLPAGAYDVPKWASYFPHIS